MQPFHRAIEFLKRKSYEVVFYDRPDDDTRERKWSNRDYLNANEISLYTNRAIAKRAEKVSEVNFYLVNRRTKDVLEEHALLDILRKPNEFQTGLQFWSLYQKYRDLCGAAYIWVEPSGEVFKPGGKVKGLHLLRSDCVSLNYAKDGTIASFKYSAGRSTGIEFPADQVIYAYTPDPSKPTEGMSLLRAGIRAIDTEVQLSRYHANVIRNGGNVGNVMKFKAPNLTRKQVEDLKQQYELQFAEAKNAGKPMFLGGDADIIKLGLSPDELSYMESKRLILDDIVIMTGVPKSILGVTSGETFANADASIAIFLRETIKPLLADLTTTLDWRFVPEEYDLEFTDPTPENVELKLKTIESGIKNSYMTINEARDMQGLEPIADGDQVLIPFSVVPLSSVNEKPEDKPDNNGAPANNDDDEKEKGRKRAHPLRDAFIRARYGKLMVKRMDRQEGRALKTIEDYFRGQRTRLIEHVQGSRTFRRKDILDEAFNHELELNLAKGALLPLLRDILKRAGTDAADFAGASHPFHLSSRIESWLDSRATIFAGQVTDTTFEKLKSEFRQSLEEGESRQQLVSRIRSTYDAFTKSRSQTIARTEVHAATQTGTIEGYKQAGLDTKIWVAVADEATRESHFQADGEEVPIDQMFSNGLRYPGDPSGPAEEVINCRCSI